MFFFGCQKSNLDEANLMKTSASHDAGVWWNAFRDNLVQIQKKINKLSFEWCLPMPFGGEKDKTLGVENWQSGHCLTFTRISLY